MECTDAASSSSGIVGGGVSVESAAVVVLSRSVRAVGGRSGGRFGSCCSIASSRSVRAVAGNGGGRSGASAVASMTVTAADAATSVEGRGVDIAASELYEHTAAIYSQQDALTSNTIILLLLAASCTRRNDCMRVQVTVVTVAQALNAAWCSRDLTNRRTRVIRMRAVA